MRWSLPFWLSSWELDVDMAMDRKRKARPSASLGRRGHVDCLDLPIFADRGRSVATGTALPFRPLK